MTRDDLATRDDLNTLRNDLHAVEQRLQGNLHTLEHHLEARIDELKAGQQASDGRLDRLEVRVDRIEAKVDQLDKKIDNVKDELGARIDNLALDLRGEMREMRRDFASGINMVLDRIGDMIGVVDERYKDLPGRTDRLEQRFEAHCRDPVAHKVD